MTGADLIVELPGAGSRRVVWTLIDRETGTARGHGELGTLTPPLESIARVFYVLPSADILVRRLTIPARRDHEARQAAPFALEDEMASDLADTEVAIGPADADGKRLAIAASKACVAEWRAIAARIGIRPAHVVPDAWSLSREDGDLILADRGGDILFLNHGIEGPVCGWIDAALAGQVLPALLAASRPDRLVMSPSLPIPTGAAAFQPKDIRGLPALDLPAAISRLDSATLRKLPALLGSRHSTQRDWGQAARPFARAASLCAAALVLFVALSVGEGMYLRAQSDRIDARTEAAFRDAFPDVTRVVNLEAQLRQRMQGTQAPGRSEFVRLAGILSAVAADSETLRIDAMRYDAAGATLGISATYADFASFEQFSARAREAGLIVEDGGARQTGNTLSGEFTVRFP